MDENGRIVLPIMDITEVTIIRAMMLHIDAGTKAMTFGPMVLSKVG